METETKKKGKVLIIIIVVLLVIGTEVASFYVGKNYDSIFIRKASKEEKEETKEETEQKEEAKEEVDINSTLVKTLYEKYRGLTKVRCESESFKFDVNNKRMLALKNIPTSKIEHLAIWDAEADFIPVEGYEHEINELNFKYSSQALHETYISLFGSDSDLVDESFNGTYIDMNTYNADLKMYANYVFRGGCAFSGVFSDEVTSAEKDGNNLTLYSKVSYTSSGGSSFKEALLGNYQYDFVFDDERGTYILKDFKKIS